MLRLGSVFESEKNHDGKYIYRHVRVFFFGMETSWFAKRWCLGFLFGLGCVKCWGILWGWEVVFVVATCNLSSGICCVRGYHIYLRILDMKGRARKNPTKAADMFLIYTFYWKRFCIRFGLLMLFFLFLIFCCKGDSKTERFNYVSSIVLFNQFLEAPRGRFLSVLFLLEPTNMNPRTFKTLPRGCCWRGQQDFRRPKKTWGTPSFGGFCFAIFCHFRIFLTSTLIPTYHIAMLRVTLCFRYRWV